MGKFCKYCGKATPEGVCDCPQATTEAEELAKRQLMAAMQATATTGQAIAGHAAATVTAPAQPQQQTATPLQTAQPQQQTATPPQGEQSQQTATPLQSEQAQQAAQMMTKMKDLLLGFVKNPVDAMQQAAQTADKTPQYLMAALFAVVTLICSFIMLSKDLFGDKRFTIALTLVVAVLVIRMLYAVGVAVLGKKANPALTVPAAVGVFCLTLIVDTAVILLLTISMIISLFELATASLLFWLAATVIMAVLAAWVLMGQQMAAVVRISLMLQLVLMIILVFVCRGFAVTMLKQLGRGLF